MSNWRKHKTYEVIINSDLEFKRYLSYCPETRDSLWKPLLNSVVQVLQHCGTSTFNSKYCSQAGFLSFFLAFFLCSLSMLFFYCNVFCLPKLLIFSLAIESILSLNYTFQVMITKTFRVAHIVKVCKLVCVCAFNGLVNTSICMFFVYK